MISRVTWPEVESWLSPSKKRRYPCSGPPPLYQDLSTCYDWPVKRPLSICQSRWKEIRNARPVIRWVYASQPRVTNRDFNIMYATQANNVPSHVFSFTETKSSGRNKRNLAYLRKFSSLNGSIAVRVVIYPNLSTTATLGTGPGVAGVAGEQGSNMTTLF